MVWVESTIHHRHHRATFTWKVQKSTLLYSGLSVFGAAPFTPSQTYLALPQLNIFFLFLLQLSVSFSPGVDGQPRLEEDSPGCSRPHIGFLNFLTSVLAPVERSRMFLLSPPSIGGGAEAMPEERVYTAGGPPLWRSGTSAEGQGL